jgi:hypothetical protein
LINVRSEDYVLFAWFMIHEWWQEWVKVRCQLCTASVSPYYYYAQHQSQLLHSVNALPLFRHVAFCCRVTGRAHLDINRISGYMWVQKLRLPLQRGHMGRFYRDWIEATQKNCWTRLHACECRTCRCPTA